MSSDNIKELIEMGVSLRRIAHSLKISTQELNKIINLNQWTVMSRQWDPSNETELLFIQQASVAGVSVRTLASKIYHISTSTLIPVLVKLGLPTSTDSAIHHYNVDIFDNIDSENKAYWLGYIFGDGTNQEKSLNFSVAENKFEHIQQLAIFMGDEFDRVQIKNGHATYKIYSQELFNKLNELGLISPKTNIKFPTLEQTLYSHFLRGYLDGKSSLYVSPTNEWRLSISGNLNILNNIIKNSPVELKISKNSSGYNCIVISGNNRVLNFCNWLYKDASIYLDAKYDKYQQLKQQ